MWLRSRYTFVKAFAVNFKQQSNEEAAAALDRPSKNAGFPFDVFLKAGEGLQTKFGHLNLACHGSEHLFNEGNCFSRAPYMNLS